MATSARTGEHGEDVHADHDVTLCHEAHSELRALADSCRNRAQRAYQASTKMTLEMVALFCEGGTQAIHHYLELSLAQSGMPHIHNAEHTEAAAPNLGEDAAEWRPGEDAQEPMD